MISHRRSVPVFAALVFAWLAPGVGAQSDDTTTDTSGQQSLFAVEIRTGPNRDESIAANEQAYFREHSVNLRQLREAGHIVFGARYSDIGLIVFSAASVEDVQGWMDADPSMVAGTFVYEVHVMNVFFPGRVQSR